MKFLYFLLDYPLYINARDSMLNFKPTVQGLLNGNTEYYIAETGQL